MNAMLDLFEMPAVPGRAMADEFILAAEEAALIAHIDETSLSPFRFQQWAGKRLTRSHGWSYDFETGVFAPTEPLPEWLDDVRKRSARFAGLLPADLAQALLIRYDPGAGIGWHRDRPVFEHVVGISLGQEATLRLRRRNARGFERAKANSWAAPSITCPVKCATTGSIVSPLSISPAGRSPFGAFTTGIARGERAGLSQDARRSLLRRARAAVAEQQSSA